MAGRGKARQGKMFDYRVKVRIYNNRIRQRRESMGLTLSQFSAECGVSLQVVLGYETMRRSPLKINGNWKETAVKIAQFLGCAEWEIFPRHAIKAGLKECEYFVDHENLDRLVESAVTPEDAFAQRELTSGIAKAIATLSMREQNILIGRYFENNTYQEMAEELGISRQRVLDIERRALRRLRHPLRSNILATYI